MRNTFRTIHLFAGLVCGAVVVVVALCGAIYCFEPQLRRLVHPELHCAPYAGVPRPGKAVRELHVAESGAEVRGISVPADNALALQVNTKNKRQYFFERDGVKPTGTLDLNSEFLAKVLDIHRSLGLGEAGKLITGTSALLVLVMTVTGITLWWPRNNRLLRRLKPMSINGRWRLYDLHSVLGFYVSFILLVSSVTGTLFAFKWAEGVLFGVAGHPAQAPALTARTEKNDEDPLDKIAFHLWTHYPGKSYTINMPRDPTAPLRCVVALSERGLLKAQDLLWFDDNGALVRKDAFEKMPLGQKIRMSNYNLHTGLAFGIAGQIIMSTAMIVIASLPVTGFVLWLRRKPANRAASSRRRNRDQA